VGFGEGFAIELFIDLFDAFPGADAFNVFAVAALVFELGADLIRFPISAGLHAYYTEVEMYGQ
jgi:hypothetical protein